MSPHAVNRRAALAWRAAFAAALLNLFGMPLDLLVGAKVPDLPRWPDLVSMAVGAILIGGLLARRSLPPRLASTAFFVNSLAISFALWMTSPYFAAAPQAWVPFQTNKLAALTVALLGPELWAGLVSIAVYAGSAVLRLFLFAPALRAHLAVGEPWPTLAFAGVGAALLLYRVRALAAQQARVDENERQVARIGALREIQQQIDAELRLPHVLDLVLAHGSRLLQLKIGTVILRDRARTAWVRERVLGLPPSLVGQQIPPGRGLTALVAERKETVVLTNYQDFGGALAEVRAEGTGSSIATPLTAEGTMIGVLIFASRGTTVSFTVEDRQLVEMLASQAAVAIENARLVADLVHSNQLLEDRVRERSLLVEGVAHEVRNPLFAISATVEAFAARYTADPHARSYAQVLGEEVARLTRLMHDLIEYGKPGQLAPTRCVIGDVLRISLAACAALAAQRRVTLRSDEDADLPPLFVDVQRLAQVFTNLVDNAIRHAPAGSEVVLRSRRDGGEGVVVTVDDAGPGIEPADLERLFAPFFTRRPGGTGLGLSIVQRIVEQHGGRVAAANRPEGGARLTVQLPGARGGS